MRLSAGWSWLFAVAVSFVTAACGDDDSNAGGDAGTDGDTDSDTDADTDADTDTDSDADAGDGDCWTEPAGFGDGGCTAPADLPPAEDVTATTVSDSDLGICLPFDELLDDARALCATTVTGLICHGLSMEDWWPVYVVEIASDGAWDAWNALCGAAPPAPADWSTARLVFAFTDLTGGCCTGNCMNFEHVLSARPDDSLQLDIALWDPISPDCDGLYYGAGGLLIEPLVPTSICARSSSPCP